MVYLDDSRVLDTSQEPGVIWLAPRLTTGLGPDNIYTQAGWRLGSTLGEGPINGDDPWVPGIFQYNFGDILDPGNPFNQGALDLMTFLLGDDLRDFGANGLHDFRGRLDICSPPMDFSGYACFHYHFSYSNWGDGSRWEFNQVGDVYTELDYQFLGLGDFWADHSPMLYQIVPIPAAAWLFGGSIAAMGFMRRRTN